MSMKRKTSGRRKLFFAIVPLLTLFIVSELVLRITGIANSMVMPLSFPGEHSQVHRADEHLFWAMQPDLEVLFQGVTVRTNSRGLRHDPIEAKRADEFRILSLGESTTFGAGVENDQTYAARLQVHLNQRDPSKRFNVINAGVSGYTSFQSLVYLKRHGIALAPDMVLFYHELNDYLPTTVTNVKQTVIGESLTDKQRYQAKHWRWHRKLLGLCATYRGIHLLAAHVRISLFKRAAVRRDAGTAGKITGTSQAWTDGPSRVSPEERLEILQELLELSKSAQFQLVVIHPSYLGTIRHGCELTQFCDRQDVPMYESYDDLHPAGRPSGDLFWDAAHPKAEGHDLLASALAKFLTTRDLVPLK
jgi:lysophospholipase L1-like esterase